LFKLHDLYRVPACSRFVVYTGFQLIKVHGSYRVPACGLDRVLACSRFVVYTGFRLVQGSWFRQGSGLFMVLGLYRVPAYFFFFDLDLDGDFLKEKLRRLIQGSWFI
jgi:hypothetical protein